MLDRTRLSSEHDTQAVTENYSHPSGSLAMTIPAPPAPPNGAIPVRIDVKIANPLACWITLGGILRSTLRFLLVFFFPLASTAPGLGEEALLSSVMTPSTGNQQECKRPMAEGLTCECPQDPLGFLDLLDEVIRDRPKVLRTKLLLSDIVDLSANLVIPDDTLIDSFLAPDFPGGLELARPRAIGGRCRCRVSGDCASGRWWRGGHVVVGRTCEKRVGLWRR